jgi:hypothetical protein
MFLGLSLQFASSVEGSIGCSVSGRRLGVDRITITGEVDEETWLLDQIWAMSLLLKLYYNCY